MPERVESGDAGTHGEPYFETHNDGHVQSHRILFRQPHVVAHPQQDRHGLAHLARSRRLLRAQQLFLHVPFRLAES
jgi:hypothetical protein